MTDEEIVRRLAEIEGIKAPIKTGNGTRCVYVDGEYSHDWNPLTNKGQAFERVEKYGLSISKIGERWVVNEAWSPDIAFDPISEGGCDAYDLSLPRAICLAIIAAHEGER